MTDQEIIDLFYNYIIKEAQTGRINSYMYYNIPFEVMINNNYITRCNCNYEGIEIPLLKINDKELFDKYLVLYVKKAKLFYDNNNFPEELNNAKYYEDDILISKEKSIICSLFANATYEDFLNPLKFLSSRIEMFDNPLINMETKDLGYSEILKGRIIVTEQPDHIYNETPYVLKTKIVSDDLESTYYLPDIRIGKNSNETIIYSIQNTIKNEKENKYVKYVSRILRKVDNGLDVKNDNEKTYGIGNLKDITPSFLVTAVIALSLIDQNKITIPSFLISRWNAKRIANLRKSNNFDDDFNNQILLQRNISEKFIRVFRRIAYHFNGIDIEALPFDSDSSMKLTKSNNVYSDNKLLEELYELNNEKVKANKF